MAVTLPVNGSASTSGSLSALVKKLYPERRLEHIYKRGFPFFAEVKKIDDLEGSGVVIPVIHDHANVSNSFVGAQTKRHPSKSDAFTITGITQYGVGQVDGVTMLKMRGKAGAFVRAIDNEILSVMEGMKKHTALQMYRSSSGYIGVVDSVNSSADTITLTNKSDAWNFNYGQQLVIASASTGAGARTATDLQVVGIDPSTGVLTLDDASVVVAGDYIFNYGDQSNTSNDGVGSLTGLRDWIPSAAATDTLFGVARSGQPRLFGHRITDTALSTEEAIQEACYMIAAGAATGGAEWRAYMHPLQFRLLVFELGSKVNRDAGGKGVGGYNAVEIHTACGTVKCVPDPACPEDAMWVGDINCMELHHLGPLFHPINEDKNSILRVTDADRFEFRFRSYRQLACTAPVRWAYIARNTAI